MIINPIKNSDEVFDAIELIASVSGNEKQRLINMAMKYPRFQSVCKLALDPFKTYGVKKVVVPGGPSVEGFTLSTFELLEGLEQRQLTGNAAKAAIEAEMQKLSAKSQVLLARVIQKDLRAAFSAKAINKAKPGFIFVFECMLSHKFESKRITSYPVAVEEKFDGIRCLAIYQNGKVSFYSRTGKELLNYEAIGEEIKAIIESTHGILKDSDNPESKMPMIMDGEIISGDFNTTAGEAHRKGEQATNATYHVFEMMPLEVFESGGDKRPYSTRRQVLNVVFGEPATKFIRVPEVWMMHSEEEVYEKFNEILSAGGEGVIVKPLLGSYEKKRSHNWLKIKDCQSLDLPIVAYEEGEGKFEGLIGALVVNFNGVLVPVGSGLTDELRNELKLDSPDRIGDLIEVQYHEVTPKGSLRHPRFVRFRDDKPHEDGMGI